MQQIKIFSPASVSNVCCGFDVLGFSVEGIGDELIISKSKSSGVKIKKIIGYDVPTDELKNTASVAGNALLDYLEIDGGFEIEINKKIKPGSGIGSSASSAVGSVFGINKLLGEPMKLDDLIQFAMKGEFISSKSAPADNVASALHGGLILVNNHEDFKVSKLPAPENLYALVHHPLIEIKTSNSRHVLPEKIDLDVVPNQLASIGGFIHSLHTVDFNLMKKSLKDFLVEKHRSNDIPCFKDIKKATLENGALCCSISGSGPSIFTLVNGYTKSVKIKSIIDKIYDKNQIEFNSYITSLNARGVHEIQN